MKLEDVILRGTRAAQPSFLTVAVGTLYFVTNENKLERNSGAAWESYDGGITQLTGDVTAGPGSGSQVATIPNNIITLAKLVDIATASILGRITVATGDPEVLTATQATSLLNIFTSILKGLVPASGGGTANFLRADGTWAAAGGSSSNPFAIVYHNTTQSITTSTWTILNFNSEEVDASGFHDNVTNNSRLTVPAGLGGLYQISMHANFAASPTGDRFIAVSLNGSVPGGAGEARPIWSRTRATTEFEAMISISGLMQLVAGDYIEFYVFQNSGGNLNTGNATDRELDNQFELVRVST